MSSVTATGSAATTRTAPSGRPASAAACRNVGLTCDRSVAGPVIQVQVPDVRRPASRSICGPSAAMYTSGRGAPGIIRAPRVVTVSPVALAGSPASSGSNPSRYSLSRRTGLSQGMPHIPSVTAAWVMPSPSRNRPPEARLTVSARCAICMGCWFWIGTTPLATSMVSTSRSATASTVRRSSS